MSAKDFYLKLIGVVIVVIAAIVPIHQHKLIHDYQLFSWLSFGFFLLFSIGVFIISSKAAKSENKNLFLQVFLLSILLKLIGCGLLVIGYTLKIQPETRHFIVPFLLIYTIFTVYEVYFVSKLAKI